MKLNFSGERPPDFNKPFIQKNFKQIMFVKFQGKGWAQVNSVRQYIYQKYQNQLNKIDKQQNVQIKLISEFFSPQQQDRTIYPNIMSIFYDLKQSLYAKPLLKKISKIQKTQNQISIYQTFYQEFQKAFTDKNSIKKNYLSQCRQKKPQILKIKEFNSFFNVYFFDTDTKFQMFKWQFFEETNNLYYFLRRKLYQLLDRSKNDAQLQKQLLQNQKIFNIGLQTFICLTNDCDSQYVQSQNNSCISLIQLDNVTIKTKYFFMIKLRCQQNNQRKTIGCTSKCYFYCLSPFALINEYQQKNKTTNKGTFKCIERCTFKDDCLRQGDVLISFYDPQQRYSKNSEGSEKIGEYETSDQSEKSLQTRSFEIREKFYSKKEQQGQQTYWVVQKIIAINNEKQNKKARKSSQQDIKEIKNSQNAQKYKYFQPLPINKQFQNECGAFFFNGFLAKTQYPLKVKFQEILPQQVKNNQIKMNKMGRDKIIQIKFNIFEPLTNLILQLKYRYKYQLKQGVLNKEYKFTLKKQDFSMNKTEISILKESDTLASGYRQINLLGPLQDRQKALLQIQCIQQDNKKNQSQQYTVILEEGCIISIIDKQKGSIVSQLKQNDICLTYDQKLDDTDQNRVIKVQKLVSEKISNKIFKYNLKQPKNSYQVSFISSDNITFSVGKDAFSSAISQQFVCDLYPKVQYTQNRFKAIKTQQVKDLNQLIFYQITFEKKDFILYHFPVRIKQYQKGSKVPIKQLNIQFCGQQNSNQFIVYMYNNDRMQQPFKFLIDSQFQRLKTHKSKTIFQLSKQFCLIINNKLYSMYNNFKDVINQDTYLQDLIKIKVFISEPKPYFQRQLYKQKILYSYGKKPPKKSNDTTQDAIQKFNNPQNINQVKSQYLMYILNTLNIQQTSSQAIQTNSQQLFKKEGKLYTCFYKISSKLIKKQHFQKKYDQEKGVFYFRDIIKVQITKPEKQQDITVFKIQTYNLLFLQKEKISENSNNCYYLPAYTYFFIQQINSQDNIINLREIPSNISFSKKIVLWADQNWANNDNDSDVIKLIKKNPFLDSVFVINGSQMIRWIKLFEPVLNKLKIQIQIITNNYKSQYDDQENSKKGGLLLIKSIQQIIQQMKKKSSQQMKNQQKQYTNILLPIIYCGDIQVANKQRAKMKMDKECMIINDQASMSDLFTMSFLVACDKFRGSLQSKPVNTSIINTLKNFCKERFGRDMKYHSIQMADGGQGTLNVIKNYIKGGTQIKFQVAGPFLKTKVKAKVYINSNNNTAYIQMAQASGINLIKATQQKNPYITTTKGVGQLILHLIERNNKSLNKVYIFCGGSATNEGGMGMASALGYKFYDINNKQLRPIGQYLKSIHKIVPPPQQTMQKLKKVEFFVLTDVNNCFFGPNGATRVFGPQKGASTQEMLKHLDQGMMNLNKKLSQWNICPGVDLQKIQGSGAAGGLAGGCIAFLGAKIQSGSQYTMKLTDLESRIKQSNIVITGEGRLDKQTLSGKAVMNIIKKAQKYNKQCWIICGICQFGQQQMKQFYKLHPKTKVIQLAENQQDVKDAIVGVMRRIQDNLTKHLDEYFPKI